MGLPGKIKQPVYLSLFQVPASVVPKTSAGITVSDTYTGMDSGVGHLTCIFL